MKLKDTMISLGFFFAGIAILAFSLNFLSSGALSRLLSDYKKVDGDVLVHCYRLNGYNSLNTAMLDPDPGAKFIINYAFKRVFLFDGFSDGITDIRRDYPKISFKWDNMTVNLNMESGNMQWGESRYVCISRCDVFERINKKSCNSTRLLENYNWSSMGFED